MSEQLTQAQRSFLAQLRSGPRAVDGLCMSTNLSDSSVRLRLYRLRDRGLVEKHTYKRTGRSAWRITRRGSQVFDR